MLARGTIPGLRPDPGLGQAPKEKPGHRVSRAQLNLLPRRRVQNGRNAELRTQRSFVVAGSQVTKPTRQ
jgi:hypothetical protein